MSEEAARPLSLLEQLRVQHANFQSQKQMTETNLNQLVGAIYACEIMIKKHEDEEQKGAPENVETNDEEKEQASQE